MTSQPSNQRPRAGFVLSMIGGAFILIGSLILSPIFPHLFFFACIFLSVIVIVSAILLLVRPIQHVRWGRVGVISSLPALVGTTLFLLPIYTLSQASSGVRTSYSIFAPDPPGANAALTALFQYYNPAGAYAALGIIFILFLLLVQLGSFLALVGSILGIVWSDVQRPSAGFRLSLLAGILMVIPIPFVLLWARAVGSTATGPNIFSSYQGLMSTMGISSAGALSLAVLIGLLAALVVTASTILLYRDPQESRRYGLLVILFSVLSIFGTGGYWLGLIFGLLGGVLSYRWRPRNMSPSVMAASLPQHSSE